ncbi:MAG: sulfur oxidation c-type cytochrome SoxA [Phenylobacterium sp.]|nr:sulfur oxidation c-type cytochrome SoxA [Phenylobacterium sp.]
MGARLAIGLTAAGLFGAVAVAVAAQEQADRPRSGLDYVSPETRAMQADDAANPAMLWVQDGERLWAEPVGPEGRSCASCHGEAAKTMRGVAARYPAFDARLRQPVDLQSRVNACREGKQGAAALPAEGDDLLALTAYVAHQSRGLPIAPSSDPRLTPHIENGRRLYQQRLGQLDLSCAACHDGLAGQRLSGSLIPQAQANAYPVYRLEWQTVGSLQRRFRNCMVGVRAEPFDYGSAEFIDLELYLMSRARGLAVETPGVRP